MTQSADFQDGINKIAALSHQASAAILSFYGHEDRLGISAKQDNTPVTRADLAAHRILSEGLGKILPLPVVSEESTATQNVRHDDYWLIDPIDGTGEFIRQSGQFCIAIARIRAARPVLGMIYAPLSDTYWYAGEGQGAWKHSPEKGRERLACRTVSNKPLLISAFKKRTRRFARFAADAFGDYDILSQPSAIKFCRIAEGDADIYPKISATTSEWDTAAGEILLCEAGGGMRYFPNEVFSYGVRDIMRNPPFIAYGAGFESRIDHCFEVMRRQLAAEGRVAPFFLAPED